MLRTMAHPVLSVTHNTGCPTVLTGMRLMLNGEMCHMRSVMELSLTRPSDLRPVFVLWAQSRALRPC